MNELTEQEKKMVYLLAFHYYLTEIWLIDMFEDFDIDRSGEEEIIIMKMESKDFNDFYKYTKNEDAIYGWGIMNSRYLNIEEAQKEENGLLMDPFIPQGIHLGDCTKYPMSCFLSLALEKYEKALEEMSRLGIIKFNMKIWKQNWKDNISRDREYWKNKHKKGE